MSDYCSIEIIGIKSELVILAETQFGKRYAYDKDLFDDFTPYVDGKDGMDDVYYAREYQADCAWYTEIGDFCQRTVSPTFFGSHSGGSEYPEGVFACINGSIGWVDAVCGNPIVRVKPPNGDIEEDELQMVKDYLRIYDLANIKLFGKSAYLCKKIPSPGRTIRVIR